MPVGASPSPEVRIDADLVRALVAGQFPEWTHLPVRPVESGGWDNRTFRLGDELCVRLPSAARYAGQVEMEHRLLPRLAARLPLPVPVSLVIGRPAAGYPWAWSIRRWIEGAPANADLIEDLGGLASALAHFLTVLRAIDPDAGPRAGLHNFFRGGPLAVYDAETRSSIETLDGEVDAAAATDAWEDALSSTWTEDPAWVHGDVSAGNLLVRDGRLAAVIDFGCVGVGDPACDLAVAWSLFSGESRETFRAGTALDTATWARGRGWALWKGLITLAEHAGRDEGRAAEARRVVGEVLDDRRGGDR